MSKNKYEIDMCNGTIMDKLVSFAIPLMVSGILQLMFNAVDIIVVGRFSGSQALAAVGSTTALINVFTNLFIGVSLGANVLAARFYAAGKAKEMSETVHTSVTLALVSGVAMAAVGLVFSRWALEVMGTPADVIDQSTLYMRIYFLGMPFFMLYNYGAAILRAVGDTRRPLLFLVVAGVTNAVLNMILVIVFHLGVAGVAIATIISQLISCILVLRCLYMTDSSYQLRFSRLCMKKFYLVQIFQVGIQAGVQRMDRVLLDCGILSFVIALVLGCGSYMCGGEILKVYTEDPEVIRCGVEILSITTVPYFLCGIMDLFPGALRGMGHSGVPMILSIIGTVGTRIVWIFWIFPQHRSLYTLFISYPASWFITIVLQVICFVFVRQTVHGQLKGTGKAA